MRSTFSRSAVVIREEQLHQIAPWFSTTLTVAKICFGRFQLYFLELLAFKNTN